MKAAGRPSPIFRTTPFENERSGEEGSYVLDPTRVQTFRARTVSASRIFNARGVVVGPSEPDREE